MASQPEFETNGAFGVCELASHDQQFPAAEIEVLIKQIQDTCKHRESDVEKVSTYLRGAIATARHLPHDLAYSVSGAVFNFFRPATFPYQPLNEKQWDQWLNDCEGTVNKLTNDERVRHPLPPSRPPRPGTTPRAPGAAEEHRDREEPAHLQPALQAHDEMKSLSSTLKRKLTVTGTVEQSGATRDRAKRRKIGKGQMIRPGGRASPYESEHDEGEDSSGSQGPADDDVEQADDSDDTVRRGNGGLPSNGDELSADGSPVDDRTSGDESPASIPGTPSPAGNSSSGAESEVANLHQEETEEDDSPRHSEPQPNVAHSRPDQYNKYQHSDSAPLPIEEVCGSGMNHGVAEHRGDADEVTGPPDLETTPNPETAPHENSQEDRDRCAPQIDGDSEVVAEGGVRRADLGPREQHGTEFVTSPTPQDDEMPVAAPHAALSSGHVHDRLVTPPRQTGATPVRCSPVSYNISNKFPSQYVDDWGNRVIAKLMNRRFPCIKHKKQDIFHVSEQQAQDFTDNFLGDYIGSIKPRVRRFMQELRDRTDMPGSLNSTPDSNDSELVRKAAEPLHKLLTMDIKLDQGVTSMLRAVAIAEFARNREQLIRSKSGKGDADIQEKVVGPQKKTVAGYKEYTQAANLARILEQAWGPGAVLFMPSNLRHFGAEKLKPISCLAEIVEVMKQEDKEDMFTRLARCLEENILKPVKGGLHLTVGFATGIQGSDDTIADMFPKGRSFLA